MKIPKKFKLFGTTINVEWDNKRLNDRNVIGECFYVTSKITLCDCVGLDKLSEDKIEDVFYHEKVHMILDTMSKHDLSKDEEFVDIFAKLLRQSDVTSEY